MFYKYIAYLIFCALCVAKPPPGGPQDGLSGRPPTDDDSQYLIPDNDMPDGNGTVSSDDVSDISENDLLEVEGMDDAPNFLETESLDDIQLELIDGDKAGSSWLVVSDIFICHKFSESESEIFWECSGRRTYGCPFRI